MYHQTLMTHCTNAHGSLFKLKKEKDKRQKALFSTSFFISENKRGIEKVRQIDHSTYLLLKWEVHKNSRFGDWSTALLLGYCARDLLSCCAAQLLLLSFLAAVTLPLWFFPWFNVSHSLGPLGVFLFFT